MLKKFALMTAFAFVAGTTVMAEEAAKPVEAAKPAATAVTAPVEPAAKAERSFWCQFGRDVLLYIPNRLLDVSDLLTLRLGAGGPFAVKAKVTGFMELGGTHGPQYFIGKGFARQFGGGYQDGTDFGLFCCQTNKVFVEDTFGSFNEYAMDQEFGLANCDLEPYNSDTLDFWSIGATAAVGVGCDAQVHLQELPDTVLGFVCLDPSNDDLK